MAARIDPRLVKLTRTYTVVELAMRLGLHRNTVRHWQSEGLTAIDRSRPVLFHGSIVRAFLTRRDARRKSPCSPGTLYCFRCRAPRRPALAMVDYLPINDTSGNVRAICDTCETIMYRRTRKAALVATMPGCDVQIVQALPRLSDRPRPSLNGDFKRKAAAR